MKKRIVGREKREDGKSNPFRRRSYEERRQKKQQSSSSIADSNGEKKPKKKGIGLFRRSKLRQRREPGIDSSGSDSPKEKKTEPSSSLPHKNVVDGGDAVLWESDDNSLEIDKDEFGAESVRKSSEEQSSEANNSTKGPTHDSSIASLNSGLFQDTHHMTSSQDLMTQSEPMIHAQHVVPLNDDFTGGALEFDDSSSHFRRVPRQGETHNNEMLDLWNWQGSDMDVSSDDGTVDLPEDLSPETFHHESKTESKTLVSKRGSSPETFQSAHSVHSGENGEDNLASQTEATPKKSNATTLGLRTETSALPRPPPILIDQHSSWDEKSVASSKGSESGMGRRRKFSGKSESTRLSLPQLMHREKRPLTQKGVQSPRSGFSRARSASNRAIAGRSRESSPQSLPQYETIPSASDNQQRDFQLPRRNRSFESEATDDAAYREKSPRHKVLTGKLRNRFYSADSEDGRTKKVQVTGKVHRLRRKLNPRSNNVNWRYRIDEHGGEHSGTDSEFVADDDSAPRSRRVSWDGTYEGSASIAAESIGSEQPSLPLCGIHPLPIKDGVQIKPADPAPHDLKEYRVKPYHCFLPGKVFKTEKEIYADMMKQSEYVEELESFVKPWHKLKGVRKNEMEKSLWGSPVDGRIGSLRVEVLGCVGLPKHKPDVGVYLVCGDTAFSTDVINGARSPIWPSKSKRAALFPVHHAFVRLFIGVFDVMTRRSTENDSFFGRAIVDIASLRPNTEYDVTLPLRASSFVYERRPRGVVRLRFSLHWFSERAAVLSYLRNPINSAPSYHSVPQPSISCADPKTFRNVAVTVHGTDLPGKYSRKAFQATMREFNLYRLNILFALRMIVQDAVVYEKPMMSSYLFAAWMHCVYLSSVRLVPVYFVGLLIFLLLETYTLHSRNMASHLGYAPVTLKEIFMALVNDEQSNYIEPLLTTKKLKTCRRDSDIEIEAHDHREFPFSERNAYPKLSVEESVVRRQNSVYKRDRKEEINLVGRLSIYAKQGQCVDQIADEMKRATSSMSTLSVASMDEAVIEDEGSDEEVEMSGDHDLQEMAREHSEDLDGSNELQYLGMFNSAARRIPLGPPQDASKKPPRNIPPQVHLARVEDVLNTITRSISMDRVYNSTLSVRPHNDVNRNSSGGRDDDEEESNNAETTSKRRRRQPLDDFDKRLGLRRRHPNPVAEITSSFLGPLMRIFRIICISVRVLFNISVWKDPYMSFWALCFLVAIMIILIFFPWRLFLFIVGLIALGPQNIFLRKHIHNLWQLKPKGNTQREKGSVEAEVESGNEWKQPQPPSHVDSLSDDGGENGDPGKRGSRQRMRDALANLKERRQRRRNDRIGENGNSDGINDDSNSSQAAARVSSPYTRPAFSGLPQSGTAFRRTAKSHSAREIVVPYSRFRKERFYDWPPDPTVARATPVNYEDCVFDGSYVEMQHQQEFASQVRRRKGS